jgi:hypothetical protein
LKNKSQKEFMKYHPNPSKTFIKGAFAIVLGTLLCASGLLAEQTWKQESFTGDDAIEHLKSTGQYESLSEAIKMARYSVREVEGEPEKAWAQNPKHGLNATFDTRCLHLRVRDGDEKGYESNWRLESAEGEAVCTGELRRNGPGHFRWR